MPTIAGADAFARNGGLVKYGPNVSDNFRQAAVYIDRILKGAKSADARIAADNGRARDQS
jgi:putative ABC transport system substrate-binding protein